MSPRYGGGYGSYGNYGFRPYVPVYVRRAQAQRSLPKLLGKDKTPAPVVGQGKTIAASFWGRAWCRNLERYSDFSNRLPRGRTYVRNGSVVHLDVLPGEVLAYVSGSELYKVKAKIRALRVSTWKALCADCVGSIDSLVELLRGELNTQVMERVCQLDTGLFPSSKDIEFECSCPDFADMCKHVAAVLYGVGVRLDDDPDLLFRLRQVSAAELVADAGKGLARGKGRPDAGRVLAQDKLAEVFGIELGGGEGPAAVPTPRGRTRKTNAQKAKAGKAKAGKAKTRASKARKAKASGPQAQSGRRVAAGLADLDAAIEALDAALAARVPAAESKAAKRRQPATSKRPTDAGSGP